MVNVRCPHDLSKKKKELKCNGFKTGVLIDKEILDFKLISDPQLIDSAKFDADFEKCLKGTTYDLRLGEGHYLYLGSQWSPLYIGNDFGEINTKIPESLWFTVKDTDRNILTIPPFGCALIQRYETIGTLSVIEKHKFFITGRFDLKLDLVQKVFFSQQATQVEPYYKGKLFCFLFNNSGDPQSLKYKNDK